jgi:hypothetical protein
LQVYFKEDSIFIFIQYQRFVFKILSQVCENPC